MESNKSNIDVDFDEDFKFQDSENDDKDYCNMPDFDGEEDDALTSIDTDDLFVSNCLTYVGGYLTGLGPVLFKSTAVAVLSDFKKSTAVR